MFLDERDERKFQQGLNFLTTCAREDRPTPSVVGKTAKQHFLEVSQTPTILWDVNAELTDQDMPVAEEVLATRGQRVDTSDPESLLDDKQKALLTRLRILMIPGSHVMRQKHFKEIMALKKEHSSVFPMINGEKMRIGFKYGKVGVFPLTNAKTAKRPA